MNALMNFPSTCGAMAVHIHAGPGQKLPRVLDAVRPRRLDLDILETRRLQRAR